MPTDVAIPKRLRAFVLERDGRRCKCCGEDGGTFRLEIDHIVPPSLGGAFRDPANLQALCRLCNTRKGLKPRCPCQDDGYTPAKSTLAGYQYRIQQGLPIPPHIELALQALGPRQAPAEEPARSAFVD